MSKRLRNYEKSSSTLADLACLTCHPRHSKEALRLVNIAHRVLEVASAQGKLSFSLLQVLQTCLIPWNLASIRPLRLEVPPCEGHPVKHRLFVSSLPRP